MVEYNLSNIKTWSRLGSCGAFGFAAMEFPKMDQDTVILTADLCTYSGLDRLKQRYPDYIYNIGIAEQNMIGIAAGMVKEGSNVFATTYASFAASRCLDQVKVSMGYMQLGIKLVGLTAGLSVGILGATHMSVEDIAAMRAIPNITIVSPADCTETVKAVFAVAEFEGPVYLRLSGAMGNPIVYDSDYKFQIGKAVKLKSGKDISIFATGTMVYYSLKIAERLKEEGIDCAVVNIHTIKPLDLDAIMEAAECSLTVSIEEHNIMGGLGSAILEAFAGLKNRPPHHLLGIEDFYHHAGSYAYLLEKYGLTVEGMTDKIKKRYQEVRNEN